MSLEPSHCPLPDTEGAPELLATIAADAELDQHALLRLDVQVSQHQ